MVSLSVIVYSEQTENCREIMTIRQEREYSAEIKIQSEEGEEESVQHGHCMLQMNRTTVTVGTALMALCVAIPQPTMSSSKFSTA